MGFLEPLNSFLGVNNGILSEVFYLVDRLLDVSFFPRFFDVFTVTNKAILFIINPCFGIVESVFGFFEVELGNGDTVGTIYKSEQSKNFIIIWLQKVSL